MKKIAIDIALLLPDQMNVLCREINRQAHADPQSDLSKIDNYPHVTLAMGILEETLLPELTAKIQSAARDFPALPLTVIGAETEIIRTGKTSYEFQIGLTDELIALHEQMMNCLSPLLSNDAVGALFQVDGDETFNEVTAYWTENYAKQHSDPKDYTPHISLKCAKGDYTGFPLHFKASQIAICMLGNYCTCRKKLSVIELQP